MESLVSDSGKPLDKLAPTCDTLQNSFYLTHSILVHEAVVVILTRLWGGGGGKKTLKQKKTHYKLRKQTT